MAKQDKPIVQVAGTDRETVISIILGAIVVIVIGALAFRYFRNNDGNTPVVPDNNSELENIVEVQELPEQVTTQETEDGLVPTNLPAKYTVKEGDSTWKIAEAFYGSGFNYVDIEKENKLQHEQDLSAGMTLTIPKVTVRTAQDAALPNEFEVSEGEMPVNQASGPTKGDDRAAQAEINE